MVNDADIIIIYETKQMIKYGYIMYMCIFFQCFTSLWFKKLAHSFVQEVNSFMRDVSSKSKAPKGYYPREAT